MAKVPHHLLKCHKTRYAFLMKRKYSGGSSYGKRRRFVRRGRKSYYKGRKLAKFVKRVIYKAAETKSYLNYSELIPINNQTDVKNLIFFMNQGTNAEQIVGEKFHLKNIRIQGSFLSVNAKNSTKSGRIIVFKTKKPLTNDALANLPLTDLFRSGGSNIRMDQHVDVHKVDLLFDKTYRLTPNVEGMEMQKQFKINIKLNKDEYFDADNSGYLKKGNYYLAFTTFDPGCVPEVAPSGLSCRYTFAINYKDI